MKIFKKIAALVLVAAFVLSLAGCHPKDEIAISSGDYKITSAMYSYYLVMADSEAKSIINNSEDYDTSKKDFSYYKQKIDGKKYEIYVKDLALENCLKHIAYEKLCDENKLELDKETIKEAESQAEYYWSYYGYGQVFSGNGVGYETYKKIMLNSALADRYFKSLYDADGTKAVSADDIQKTLDENYAAVYILSKDYSSEEKPDVDALKANLEKYKTRLEAGEDYTAVYNDFNGIKEEDIKKEDTETADKDEPAPKDKNISIVGSEDTGVAFSLFDKVKELAVDTVSILHDEEAKCLYVVVKKYINADSYYRDEYLNSDILYFIKGEEFEKDIKVYADKLDYDVSNYAINQFKVKKIYDGTEV